MENNTKVCKHGNPELYGTGKHWTTFRIYQGQTLNELYEELTKVLHSGTFKDSKIPWYVLMDNKELRLPLEA